MLRFRVRRLAAGAVIVLLATACSSDPHDTGSPKSDTGAVDFARLDRMFQPIPPGGGDAWFTYWDDFASPRSTLQDFSDAERSGTKGDGAYELTLRDANDFIANSSVGGPSNHVTVGAKVGSSGSATDAGFGVVCRRNDAGDFFYAGIGSDGTYAIGRVADKTHTVLTGDGSWAASSSINVDQDHYDMRLTCDEVDNPDGGKSVDLTLTVDGERIAYASAPPTGGYDAGIFLDSFDQGDAAASFTRFTVATGDSAINVDLQNTALYHAVVLNQPAALGECRTAETKYFLTTVRADSIAVCQSASVLPGTEVHFFIFDDPKGPGAKRAQAIYREFLTQISLEPNPKGMLPNCAARGVHQGKLAGLTVDDRIRDVGAVSCGQATDGRTFVVSYLSNEVRAVASIAVVPHEQRAAFERLFDRDFLSIPTGADNVVIPTS